MADAEELYLLELDKMEIQHLIWACHHAAEPGQNSYKSLVAIQARLMEMMAQRAAERQAERPTPPPPAKLASGWGTGLFGDYSHWFEEGDAGEYLDGRYHRPWGRASLCGTVRRFRGKADLGPSHKPRCSRCLATLEKRAKNEAH